MAKAIFHREFHYSSRKRNAGWSAYPDPEPQSFPWEFIDAAVEEGCAERIVTNYQNESRSLPDNGTNTLG